MYIVDYENEPMNRPLLPAIFMPQYGSIHDKIPNVTIPTTGSDSVIPDLMQSAESKLIIKEREENLKCYNEIKDNLYNDYLGQYAVIAKGHLQQVADSFDDVKDISIDANHRFIFKVEYKKKPKGILQWPKKLKK